MNVNTGFRRILACQSCYHAASAKLPYAWSVSAVSFDKISFSKKTLSVIAVWLEWFLQSVLTKKCEQWLLGWIHFVCRAIHFKLNEELPKYMQWIFMFNIYQWFPNYTRCLEHMIHLIFSKITDSCWGMNLKITLVCLVFDRGNYHK